MNDFPTSNSDVDLVVKLNHFLGTTFNRRVAFRFKQSWMGSDAKLFDDLRGYSFSMTFVAQKDITRTPLLTLTSLSGITLTDTCTLIIHADPSVMTLPVGKYNYVLMQQDTNNSIRARMHGILEIYGPESRMIPKDSYQVESYSLMIDNGGSALQNVVFIDQPGATATSTDTDIDRFEYTTPSPSNIQVVYHGLAKRPLVQMIDAQGNEFLCSVKHSLDSTYVTISMDTDPFLWTAIFTI